MRFYILRALVKKEFQRHLANRGGIALALLLVAAAVLLSVFSPEEASGTTGMAGTVHHCFIDFDDTSPLIRALAQHLEKNQPRELAGQLRFRPLAKADTINGVITYPTGTGAIQLRPATGADARPTIHVYIWHPKGDPTALAPYEAWFWKESRRALREGVQLALRNAKPSAPAELPPEPTFDKENDWLLRESHRRYQEQVEAVRKTHAPSLKPLVPDLEVERQGLGGKPMDFRTTIATGMVVFALYFACVYLMPTLNCEERERGVLLAQALSPASPFEILAAKFLFYPVLGMGLAAVLAGIYKSEVLSSPFFWLSLLAVAGGFLGIGMTVATLARTQRAAFLGAMCYLLSVSLILLVCSQNNIPFIPELAIEYHGPRILHAALGGDVNIRHWRGLLIESVLAVMWLTAAGWLFRRRGWQ
jgi:hypothetical protein